MKESGKENGYAPRVIGSSVLRKDAWEKLSGKALYVDDLTFPRMWYGGTFRSPLCRGKILGIDFSPDFDWSRVVVVTPEDIPGPNEVLTIETDQPILAREEARFYGEPLALVGAPTRELLERALESMEAKMEELPPLFDPVKAKQEGVFKEYAFSKGEPEKAFSQSSPKLEMEFITPHQEQMYLEPQGVIGVPTEDGGVEIWGSMQCPYYVLTALCHGLGLSPGQVRVCQTVTGGGCGGKEDFPSVLGLHAALLALKAQRPVKMVFSRAEDIAYTTKRHPSRSRIKVAFSSKGVIRAMEVDLLLDGGAYCTLSPVVLSRGVLHASGAYNIENIRVSGRVVRTNSPPNGAFRGFGAPQILFGVERIMDGVARKLGLDPALVRQRNILKPGDTLPCGQELPAPGASMVLERALELSEYGKRERKAPSPSERIASGVGISLYLHGGGFVGSGEEEIRGRIILEASSSERSVTIKTSSTEMGQGASTVFPMIVAESLGISYDSVRCSFRDTREVPDSGPTVASRTTMMVGGILQKACVKMVKTLKLRGEQVFRKKGLSWWNREFSFRDRSSFSFFEFLGRVQAELKEEVFRVEEVYRPFEGQNPWNDRLCRGDAYKDYSWGANVLEIEVDRDTLEIRPLKLTSVVDVGTPLHPILATGQVEGGTLQSLGYAYMEDTGYREGRHTRHRMTNCLIPTALDTPEMTVAFEGVPFQHGPYGAKGLGELPMNGGASALAGAVEDALGVIPKELPLTPWNLYKLLQEKGE